MIFSLSDEVREKMKSRYLNNPDYNFEKVNHASNACGPLVKWACAQIQYADMLKKVEPLREELNSLEKQAETNKQRGEEVKSLIAQLEQSIASYKEEYAQLIAQAQAIKTDLENVQAKVDRSIALLKSLVIERERWEATSETFRSQMSTIIGDVLLSAAFIAYGEFVFQFHFIYSVKNWSTMSAGHYQVTHDFFFDNAQSFDARLTVVFQHLTISWIQDDTFILRIKIVPLTFS